VASGFGWRGLGRLDQLSAQAVIGLSIPQARFAGRTRLIGAIGAELSAVALVIGGDIQGDQDGLDLTGHNQDGVLPGRFGRRALRLGRYLADGGAERVVQGAFVDVRQVADQNDDPGGSRGCRAGRRPQTRAYIVILSDRAQRMASGVAVSSARWRRRARAWARTTPMRVSLARA